MMMTFALHWALITMLLGSPQDRDLKDLAWLSGCWESVNGDTIIEEVWMKPRGGLLVGSGRVLAPGKRPFVEFLEIQVHDSGTYYIARPGGNRAVSFKLVSVSDGTWTFENPAHDFPQRVIYTKRSPDSMEARIEGMVKGKLRGETFRHRRASCTPE